MSESIVSFRSVHAAWKRHLRLFIRAWFARIFAPLTEPIIYLVGFGYGLGPIVGDIVVDGVAVPYLHFVAPGMVGVSVLFHPYGEGTYGSYIRFRFSRTWQAFLAAPLNYNDIFVSELAWATTRGVIAGAATALVAALLGALSWLSLFLLFPIIVLGSILSGALGMACASACRVIDEINLSQFLIVIPMFAFAGTYYPRSSLPSPFFELSEILPLSPIVDMMRSAALGQVTFHWFSLLVALLWTALFTAIAHRGFYRKLFP